MSYKKLMQIFNKLVGSLVRRYADRESYICRVLNQRDNARDSGDALAKAILAHGAPELSKALQAYIDNDGPGLKVVASS